MIIIALYLFIVGSCVASFINVVIDRVPKGESIIYGRSHCDNCNSLIKGYDLIPILSYIFLRGRCRNCNGKIGIRSLIIECLGGLLILVSFYRFGLSWMAIVSFLVSMVLLAITMIDFDTMLIPNRLVIALVILGILSFFIEKDISLVNRVIGFFSISTVMIIINIIVADSFGGGDIKLMAVSGFLLGWSSNILAGFIGVLIAGGYGVYLLAIKKNNRKDHIAFGPYLCMGIYLAMMYGNEIIRTYLAIFR